MSGGLMGSVDFARLGYAVDTSGLDRARAAQDATLASGIRLGAATDTVSLRLTTTGQAALNAARGITAVDVATTKATADTHALAAAQRGLADASGLAVGKLSLLGVAAGTVAGLFAFQLLQSVTNTVTAIAALPYEAAKAADSLTMLEARLKFAFRGSATAVREARTNVIALARETGIPYSQLADQYTELAIAGRSAGLTQGDVTGLSRSFGLLGAITGADAGRIGRASWQLQQALAIGTLNGQDYRLMASNLPAIDDALGAGLGVNPNRIMSMVSNGEISAERLVEGLTKGIDILAKQAGDLPETMERARGRLQTEWELMLTDMGRAIGSSDWFQDIIRSAGGAVNNFRTINWGSAQERLRLLEQGGTGLQYIMDLFGVTDREAEIARLRPLAARERRFDEITSADQRRVEGLQERDFDLARGLDTAVSMDPLKAALRDLTNRRTWVQNGIRAHRMPITEQTIGVGEDPAEYASPWTAADFETAQRAIALLDAQIANLDTQFGRMATSAQNALDDLARYGAGAGAEVAGQIRDIRTRAAAQNDYRSDDAIRAVLTNQRLAGAQNSTGLERLRAERNRAELLPAIGDPFATRRARIEMGVGEFSEQFDAAMLANPQVQEAIAERRRLLQQQDADEQERQNRERVAADKERLEAMRAQMALGAQLGQQGRIALAQLERERDLRRAGIKLSEDQLATERARVAESVRMSEQLDVQNQQMRLLQDAAETTGGIITETLSASIFEGIETGRISGEAALRAFSNSARRILDDIIRAAMRPTEKRITDAVGEWANGRRSGGWGLGGIFGRGEDDGDKKIKDFGDAARQAGDKLTRSLSPAVAEAALKLGLSNKAAAVAALAQNSSSKALINLTLSANAASKALAAIAAEQGAESTSNLISTFASFFGGGQGSGGSGTGFAFGGVRGSYGRFANGDSMAEAGAEAILPLARGPDGKLGVAGGGSSTVTIQVIDQRGKGAPVEVEETQGEDGERMVRMIVKDQVKRQIREGALDNDMRARFGSARTIKRS